jgi:phosphoribosylaminoimidazole (AIR) synthetase
MAIAVAAEHAERAVQVLEKQGETVWRIGVVEPSDSSAPLVVYS